MEINLEGKVTHRVNRALFRRVAEVAMQDLKVCNVSVGLGTLWVLTNDSER